MRYFRFTYLQKFGLGILMVDFNSFKDNVTKAFNKRTSQNFAIFINELISSQYKNASEAKLFASKSKNKENYKEEIN